MDKDGKAPPSGGRRDERKTDNQRDTDELNGTGISAADVRQDFDERVVGRHAECDGGGLSPDGRYIMREEFTGTLTGAFYEQGDPPWRWYLLGELTRKPGGYPGEAVWCESESLFLIDGPEASKGPIRQEP
jgi:hypothetical protein